MSKYNIAAVQQRDQWPSLWVLCDGCDAECTAFISTKVTEVTSEENTSCPITNGAVNEPLISDSNRRFTIKSYCINVTGQLEGIDVYNYNHLEFDFIVNTHAHTMTSGNQ